MSAPLSRPTPLVVHHTTSPSLEAMLDAALDGTRAEGIEGIEVGVRAALAASAYDVLDADGFLLGTPANIGYMSGALKVYYPCQKARVGKSQARRQIFQEAAGTAAALWKICRLAGRASPE